MDPVKSNVELAQSLGLGIRSCDVASARQINKSINEKPWL
jgi:hypothetical protein